MGFRLIVLLLAAGIPASAASGVATSGVLGDWISSKKAIVRVHPCGNAVCVQLVQLSTAAPGKFDSLNPQTSLRTRTLCGLEIGTGFKKTDDSHLEDGHLYDPESGHTYSGIIVAKGDKLNMRGYFGISLIGRSEVWDRVPNANTKICE